MSDEPTPRSLRVLASPAGTGRGGNPYIDQLTDALSRQGATVEPFSRRGLLTRPDVVHVHWPITLVRFHERRHAVADVVKVLTLLRIAKGRGATIVWTGHDTEPHEGLPTPLHRFFFSSFLRLVDGVISLGDSASGVLRERWPELRRTPFTVVPHGHYKDAYPTPLGRAEARRLLGLPDDARVHLALGQVRAYKDLPELVTAARRVLGGDEVLCVVGAAREQALADRLTALADGDPRIRLLLRRVSEEEVSTWHAATDTCVLFYGAQTALNSGAAILALSFDRPVVVRGTPAMVELAGLIGDNWVLRVDGSAEDAVRAASSAARTDRGPEAPLAPLEWDRIGRQTVDAYRRFREPVRR